MFSAALDNTVGAHDGRLWKDGLADSPEYLGELIT